MYGDIGTLLLLVEECRLGPLKKDDPLPDPENEDLELEECDDREELEDLENEDRDDLEDDRDELDDLEERELELCLDGGILIHLFLGFACRCFYSLLNTAVISLLLFLSHFRQFPECIQYL